MTEPISTSRCGTTGSGKSQAAAVDVTKSRDAEVILDPEKDSFAATVLVHASGNVLYDRLDDQSHPLRYDMLSPSTHRDPAQRDFENHQRAEAFTGILLRRREAISMSGTPLMEEWVTAL